MEMQITWRPPQRLQAPSRTLLCPLQCNALQLYKCTVLFMLHNPILCNSLQLCSALYAPQYNSAQCNTAVQCSLCSTTQLCAMLYNCATLFMLHNTTLRNALQLCSTLYAPQYISVQCNADVQLSLCSAQCFTDVHCAVLYSALHSCT